MSEKLVRFASWLWKEKTRLIYCMLLGKEEGRKEGGGEEEKSLGMTAVHTIFGQNSEELPVIYVFIHNGDPSSKNVFHVRSLQSGRLVRGGCT